MSKALRGEGNGEGVSPPQPTRGPGEHHKWGPGWSPGRKRVWCILELEKTHLIDTNSSFLTFLGDLAGRIEMPGGLDCGPRAHSPGLLDSWGGDTPSPFPSPSVPSTS